MAGVEAFYLDFEFVAGGERLGAEGEAVGAVKLHEGVAFEGVEVGADPGVLEGPGGVDAEGLLAGGVGGEVVELGGEDGAAGEVGPPAGFGVAGLVDADEQEVSGVERGFGAGEGERDAVRRRGGGAVGDRAGGAARGAGDHLEAGAGEEAGGPDGVFVVVGTGVCGDALAVEDGLPGLAFKAWVAEGEVAEELAGVIEVLAGEVDAEPLDAGAEGFGTDGDGGGGLREQRV